MPAGNVRVQQVARGRADPLRECRISSLFGDVALATLSDANGQLAFEDVPSQYFGFQDGHPIDSLEVFYGQSIAFLDSGRRWFDINQFRFNRSWYIGARSTRALVTDALGGGPLMDAVVVQGSTPEQGFVGKTLEGGSFVVTRDFAGRATASRQSQRGGRTIVHAGVDRTARRRPRRAAAAARAASAARGLRPPRTRRGHGDGRRPESRTPAARDAAHLAAGVVRGRRRGCPDPVVAADRRRSGDRRTQAFQAGIAVPGGNLAATELTTGPVTTLLKAGHRRRLRAGRRRPRPARHSARPRCEHAVRRQRSVPRLLGHRPDDTQLLAGPAAAFGARRRRGACAELRRHAGSALVFQLPDLAGSLQGSQWLVLLQGSQVSGGSTLRHSELISLPRPIPDSFHLPPHPSFPTISSPAEGATVPAAGFTVQFALPADSIYAIIELRSDQGGELLLWQVYVVGIQTQFAFVKLPSEAETPLKSGRTWSLTVTAALRSPEVLPDIPDPYRDQAGFVQSIGTSERGVRVVASRTITITTN
jgi:hypothetical protein